MDSTWADYGIAGLALGVLALAVSAVVQLARGRAHGNGKSDTVLVGLLDRNTAALEGLQSTLARQTEALSDLRVGMAELGATLREHGARLEEIRRNTDGRRGKG